MEVNRGIFIYLTPCIPLSFKGEGERDLKEGLCPSKTPYDVFGADAPLRRPVKKGRETSG